MKITKDIKAIILLITSTMLVFGYIVTQKKQQKFEYPPITSTIHFDVMLPRYVPDNYTYNSIEISPLLISVEYLCDNQSLYFTQIGTNSGSTSLDNEENIITEYKSERYDGYMLTDHNNQNDHLIFFWDDKYSYEITGIIKENDLIKMVESIELYASPTE